MPYEGTLELLQLIFTTKYDNVYDIYIYIYINTLTLKTCYLIQIVDIYLNFTAYYKWIIYI